MIYNFCALIEKNIRVDMYLSTLFKDFSRSYIQKMIDKNQVSINGEYISKNLKIKNRDIVNIEIILEKLEEVLAEKIDLDIIYEDENLLIINKKAGINVHPVPGLNGKSGTLVNAVLYHCKNKLPSINGVERPGIIHRLDKDTSGIMLIAKSDSMMKYLSGIIKERNIGKYYLALVNGKIKDTEFKIESYIGRDPNNRLRMTTLSPVNPKIAITYGSLIGYIDNKFSLIKLKIETGRTHQIRVHLASIGFPILGDTTYGNIRVNKEIATTYQLKRQALHAYELDFELYGKQVRFKAEVKADMKKIIGDINF